MLRRGTSLFVAGLVLVACGGSGDAETGSELPPVRVSSVAPSTTTPEETTTIAPSIANDVETIDESARLDDTGDVVRVERPADAVESADRLDEPVTLAWIGGSDVVWEDRSLPAAVQRRLDRLGHRGAEVRAATMIGPSQEEIVGLIDAQVATGADGLIVGLNVSWAAWGGTQRCAGVTPAYTFYACVLEPVDGPELTDRTTRFQAIVDAVVASELPAYLYVIPHSAQALAAPELVDRIAAAEAFVASFDPELDRIAYGTQVITRGVARTDEGTQFLDMVHPSLEGVEVLADVFAPQLDTFFADLLG